VAAFAAKHHQGDRTAAVEALLWQAVVKVSGVDFSSAAAP
jgi:hypothetical protein